MDYDSLQPTNYRPNARGDTTIPDWSHAAVRLLQGVVYSDESVKVWDVILRSVSPLTDYFSRIGLLLVVDESEGMAYLRQHDDTSADQDNDSTPRLFRRTTLSFEATLASILLRDELRRFEEEDLQNERCVIDQIALLQLWRPFFPDQTDDVRLNKSLTTALRKLEELKFVRELETDPASWEIRRILKARLPVEMLERLRTTLLTAIANRSQTHSSASDSHR